MKRKGYIYITGTGADPALLGNLNDPVLSAKTPTLGACMLNIRRAVERGDWIFIISGKVPGVQQYVTGGMEVDEKIGVLAAYERFPENRLSLDDNGRVVGNIIVQPDGSQHPLDTHPAESFSARIENYIVGCDPLALTTPREFETGRRQTLDRLAEILDRPKANRVIDIVSRWRRLNAEQVDAMVRWLSDIKAAP